MGARVYFDTAPLIYAVEGVEPYRSRLEPFFAGEHAKVASSLSLTECLVRPMSLSDHALVEAFEALLLHTEFEHVVLDATVCRHAAKLRAEHRLSTPDALHAASALSARCDVFVTNDAVFRRLSGLSVVLVEEL